VSNPIGGFALSGGYNNETRNHDDGDDGFYEDELSDGTSRSSRTSYLALRYAVQLQTRFNDDAAYAVHDSHRERDDAKMINAGRTATLHISAHLVNPSYPLAVA